MAASTGDRAGMSEQNGAGNGRMTKWIGICSAGICLALVTWIFAAVQSLQVQTNGHELRILALQSNFDLQRSLEIAANTKLELLIQSSQTETRAAIDDTQKQTRAAIAELSNILTVLRIRLGDPGIKK